MAITNADIKKALRELCEQMQREETLIIYDRKTILALDIILLGLDQLVDEAVTLEHKQAEPPMMPKPSFYVSSRLDYFTAAALNALIMRHLSEEIQTTDVATDAILIATTMIKELDKAENGNK